MGKTRIPEPVTRPAPLEESLSALPDAALAARVSSGDRDAIRFLVKRHNQVLFRAARAILRDDAEAEDAVQEAYVKAIRGMAGFRSDAKLSTWLVRIAVNEALGRLRSRKRAAEVIPLAADIDAEGEVLQAVDDAASTPEAQALRAEARRIMESRIDALPDSFRAVFVLRAVEEMSVEETAAVLGIPEATVRTRFFRARSQLRESLSRSLDVAMGDAFHFAGDRCDRITEAVMARIE
jgi:RNA polymerase sigma-70 factor, ECF subfamily